LVEPENYCRFTGVLSGLQITEAPDKSWILGKGSLWLRDKKVITAGQTIKFSAWGNQVERLADLREGSCITIICSYSLDKSKDKYYPNFTLDSFTRRDDN